MAIELTFKQVAAFIKKDQPQIIEAVDKLLGMGLICSPILLGPAALPVLSLLAAKNELVRLGKSVFDAVVGKKDDDFLAHHERMQKAYALICFTSFFEALDDTLPEKLRQNFHLLASEKEILAKRVVQARHNQDDRGAQIDPVALDLATIAIPFPHPLEGLADQETRLTSMYNQLAAGFLDFIKGLTYWETLDDKGKAGLQEISKKLPSAALQSFHAQYFALAQKYADFGVWANLHEHEKAAKALKTLSEYVQAYADLVKAERSAVDIGFAKLHTAVLAIPEVLRSTQAAEVVEGLRRHYEARVAEPIIEDKYEPEVNQPQLTFPSISEAFIPQSYRALRHTGKGSRLEAEETWSGLPERDDLGAFFLSYLSSPYSIEAPLVVLGHPGSGKSLLTKVLSATLLSREFTPIRVPLREVDSDAPLENQIEQAISAITGLHIDGWAHFSGRFRNNPPVVILDGYDELLQASGKVFSGYLTGVRNFQHKEAEQGRPVRVIVTSRLTLIDKATMPTGSTIVRLLEFDKRQREKWISIWNQANRKYFKQAAPPVQPFALPSEDDADGKNVLALSEQPLLLLMLAIYDSDKNRLRMSKGLDRTILYDSLLRRFVERERKKDPGFEDLKEKERQEQVDRDMQRLGVAAIGMYNRRKLHILSQELNGDVAFFDLERKVSAGDGRPLSQADMLLGSFFFVHKSRSKQRGEAQDQYEEASAFEFLHNTFGEFLTADFILRQAIAETDSLSALSASESLKTDRQRKLDARDGFATAWFACLIYTPLFSRPVVLEMIREWADHSLNRRKRSKAEFLNQLDELILNQIRRVLCLGEMPSIMQGKGNVPFGQYPLLGHIAIYSMNLVILRTVLGDGGFVFHEASIGSHEDGSRPWDQLTHLWRSWFALDILNGLTAILEANRQSSTIRLSAKKTFGISTGDNRLETVLNVGISLADNITSGLAGLANYNPQADNWLDLAAISDRLREENIELRLQLLVKELMGARWARSRGGVEGLREKAAEAMHLAIESGRWDEFRAVVGALAGERGVLDAVFTDLFHPGRSSELFHRRPEALLEALRAAREVGAWQWLRRWGFDSFERFFHRGEWEEMVHRFPGYGSELILVSYEWGARPWGRGWRGMRGLEELFHHGWREKGGPWPAEGVGRQGGTETAVAWLLLALDERSPESLEKRGRLERLREFLAPDAMLRMIEEWPRATVELCLLAKGPRAPEWLFDLADSWIQHFTSPTTLAELLKRKAEAGTELVRLLRRIRSGRLVHGSRAPRELPHLEEISDPRYVMQIVLTWPEAGFELFRLVSENDPKWLGRFVGLDMDPRVMIDLLYELPEVAVEMLRSSDGDHRGPEQDWLREVLRPGLFMDILDRRPDVAVQLLRLFRETQSSRMMDELAADLVAQMLLVAHPPDLLLRNPDVAVELLLLAREGASLGRLRVDWLDRTFPPDRAVDLLGPGSNALTALLDVVLEAGIKRWLSRFCETLAEKLKSAGREQTVLSAIPLGLVRRIEWAARKVGNQEVLQQVQAAVQGSGEELRWRPRGLSPAPRAGR